MYSQHFDPQGLPPYQQHPQQHMNMQGMSHSQQQPLQVQQPPHMNMQHHHQPMQHAPAVHHHHQPHQQQPPRGNSAKKQVSLHVDDSNLWLTTMRVAGHAHGMKRSDPRVRVDLKSLLSTVLPQGGQYQTVSKILYGTEQHSNKSVWRAARNNGFEVRISARGAGSGDKEVDVGIADEISALAERIHILNHAEIHKHEIVLITGDRDLVPSVARALRYGIAVRLCAYQIGLAGRWAELKNKYEDLFTITVLDNLLAELAYVEAASTHLHVDRARSTCIGLTADEARREHDTISKFTARIYAGTPLLFFLSIREQTLIVEMPNVSPDEAARTLERLLPERRVEAYVVWQSRTNPQSGTPGLHAEEPPASVNNIFDLLEQPEDADVSQFLFDDDHHGGEEGATLIDEKSASKPKNAFEVVESRRDVQRAHRREKEKNVRCKWKMHCVKRQDCPHRHSAHELRMFDKYQPNQTKNWKKSLCRRDPDLHPAHSCAFAHGESDAYCGRCRRTGHTFANCDLGPASGPP